MAKFYGKIGYAVHEETRPGIFTPTITTREYFGELNRNTRSLESSGNLNDDINIANEISVVADQFAYEHVHTMKYVEFMGAKWKVSKAEVKHPRLILTIGGVYND